MIVIPQDFSESLLSLQSINPEKANIEYFVRDGQSQVTNQIIEKKVNDVLYNFNTRVVQMYFSSIVGSLSEAQNNVNGIVETESERNKKLVSNLQAPIQALPNSFDSAIASLNTLTSSSEAVEAEQESFVTSVTSLLNGNADELGSIADSMSPSDADITAQLNAFNQNSSSQLGVLGIGSTSPTLYDRFLVNAQTYESSKVEVQQTLETNIDKLEDQLASLQDLRNSIAIKYYDDSQLTPETATVENAKSALVKLLTPNSGTNLDASYLSVVNANVGATPVLDLYNLVTVLESNGAISAEQATSYRNELMIVSRYANDFGVATGHSVAYNILNSPTSISSGTVNTVATFKIATKGDTLSLVGDGIGIVNGSDVATSIQNSLNQQLEVYQKVATVSQNGNTFTISVSNSGIPDIEETSSEEGSDTEESTVPDFLPVTVSIDLAWSPVYTSTSSYQEVAYQWNNSRETVISGKVAAFNDKNDTLAQDLPTILKNFTSLNQAAQQITTIFSEPSATVDSFASLLSTDARALPDLAVPNSVYYLYNNMDLTERTKLVSDSSGQSYKDSGDELYRNIANQMAQITSVLGSKDSTTNDGTLYGQLNTLPDISEYYNLVIELGEWYTTAKSLLDTYYQSESTSLTEAQEARNAELTSLAEQLKGMQSSLVEMVSNTETTADQLQSTTEFVEDFTSKTSTIQSDTETLLKNINQYVDSANTDLEENQDYAAAFDRVLANTKNGGANNTKVFNFLSSPIEINSIQGSKVKTSVIPYYMTIIGALLVAIASFFANRLMKPRQIGKMDSLQTPNRIWSNMPNLVKIIGVAFIVASGFAITSAILIQEISKPMWVVYTFLFIFSFTILFTYLVRQLRGTGATYILAFILGIYLLLMPIIGVATTPGSFISMVYRISPLQNIENGYTAMINGISVGAVNFVILIMVSVFSIGLNLLVAQNNFQKVGE